MVRARFALVLMAVVGFSLAAQAESWTLNNFTKFDYQNHPLRLGIEAPTGQFKVLCDGKEVPYHVEVIDGERTIWVSATIAGQTKQTYTVESGRPKRFTQAVKIEQQGSSYVLDNGSIAVKLPARATGGDAPGPIGAVRLPNGKWVGRCFWKTEAPFKALKATVIGDGTAFAKLRLRYEFDAMAGLNNETPAFAEVDVILTEGASHAIIDERHEMPRHSYWEFDAAHGWGADTALCEPFGGGFSRFKRPKGPQPLKPLADNPQMPRYMYINLFPRWNQHFKDGWYFAATDEQHTVGALVVRAGEWFWPHENAIEAVVKDSGDYAGLRCPTWKGHRYWMLVAGTQIQQGHLAHRYGFAPLTKVAHTYYDWPDTRGGFSGLNFFNGGQMNPTGGIRGMGKRAVREAGRGGNLGTLSRTQVMLDPDAYGSYWLFWSPENPNFYSDFMRVPIAKATRLREHPRFKEIAKLAEQRFREDLYHSVTLPGGAGQECPGYQQHGMHAWSQLAPICKKYLDFDPTKWPRYKAGASFQIHVSQPLGGGKRGANPGGDTHPGYIFRDPRDFAAEFGVKEDVRRFKTEELPGFGVVFRNNCGTDRETYLSFKAGPNRGHYHGDQLAFHWCHNAKPIAVDHGCSYNPRAGQEHMHNRVAFHTDEMPYANMDGYERVIAFKSGNDCDVAMGQVESRRLRVVNKLPPEDWHQEWPQLQFDRPLKYRRTIVQLKNEGEDYFVIRDQFDGAQPLKATYCLHVYGDRCDVDGQLIRFDPLSCYVAEPAGFAFTPFDWEHGNGSKHRGGPEKTKGARLTISGAQGQFITVLYPGNNPPAMRSVTNGVRVGNDEIVFGGAIDDQANITYVRVSRNGREIMKITGEDVDLNRSQGEIGIFMPDAGYPFGPMPDWLIRQRNKVPDWAPEWARNR